MTERTPHFWRYRYGEFLPRWWNYLLPYSGGSDEWGRRTLIVHVPLLGWIVWAYRTCPCPGCVEVREQTARWEREEADLDREDG